VQKKYKEAEEKLRKFADFEPTNFNSYKDLAFCLALQNKEKEAEEYYRIALSYNPNDGDSYRNLAGILNADNRFKEALDCYKKAINLDPYTADIGEYLYELSIILKDQFNNYQESERYFKKVIKLNPKDEEVKRIFRNFQLHIGKLYESEKTLKSSISNKLI